MCRDLKVLAIIPARGGSKGIKRKNLVPLSGKPLIVYSIEAALLSQRLTRIIVSTDSEEIAEISRIHGADVPFLRPAALAEDDTPTLPVIQHAIGIVGGSYDAVMILQPTSPLRSSADIDGAIDLLAKNAEADSVISVVKVGDNHPARMKLIRDGWLIDPSFAEEIEGQRRQDLPEFYLRNGAIYLSRMDVIMRQNSFKGTKCMAYVMPEIRSVNIDSDMDLILARAIVAEGQNER